jgi:hypothetical protein
MGAWPMADKKLSVGLKLARRQAMTAGRHRHMIKYPVFATAAVLLIAVSAGLWTLRHEIVDTVPMIARTTEEIPDLYEDLDFYLWMANQGNDKTQDHGGNGNS